MTRWVPPWPPTAPAWVASVLALVVAQQPWWQVSSALGAVPLTGVAASGGLAQALSLVALAGAAVTLVLRHVGRRIAGLAIGAAHAGVAVLGFAHPRPSSETVSDALGAAGLAETWQLAMTPWPWAYGAIGVLGVVAGALLVLRPVAESSRSVRDTTAPVADSLASWKAMDEGIDPTKEQQ